MVQFHVGTIFFSITTLYYLEGNVHLLTDKTFCLEGCRLP